MICSCAKPCSGAAVLIVVGAHFRSALASLEDILLYAVLVREAAEHRNWHQAHTAARPLRGTPCMLAPAAGHHVVGLSIRHIGLA
jgi:hypothetical protein